MHAVLAALCESNTAVLRYVNVSRIGDVRWWLYSRASQQPHFDFVCDGPWVVLVTHQLGGGNTSILIEIQGDHCDNLCKLFNAGIPS